MFTKALVFLAYVSAAFAVPFVKFPTSFPTPATNGLPIRSLNPHRQHPTLLVRMAQ